MTPTNHETRPIPDLLFEVSWEVCNKVGGIHTVIATKASVLQKRFGNDYLVVGPDLQHEAGNPEFEEDPTLLKSWRQTIYNEGFRVRIGRWKVEGRPLAVLVDFRSLFPYKDDILKYLWETYRVDSISGQWDYIEPVLFGFAAGKTIESYLNHIGTDKERVVAHFHEWMTASGGLYLHRVVGRIATLFTTHATVLGRSLAGNGLPLYGDMERFNPDETARRFNVVAKHSLEKIAAAHLDCFTTVSELTARECRWLLDRQVDMVTPNGFEDDIVWNDPTLAAKRTAARTALIRTAEACLNHRFAGDPLIVGTSGRYEFHNKGIDVFLDALARLADTGNAGREILACLAVPAGNSGPRKDLIARLADPDAPIDPAQWPHTTHYLDDMERDPIVRAVRESRLSDPASRVKVLFVPSYLQGDDGIFDLTYYELLAGMDLTIFASYYEPWGYTPLESTAFWVPTVTTTLAGFGLWVDRLAEHEGVEVIRRDDGNAPQVVERLASIVRHYADMPADRYELMREGARAVSQTALWENLVTYYYEAYALALQHASTRIADERFDGGTHDQQINFVRQQLTGNAPSWTRLMVEKSLPQRLRPLEILSRNLWWSWTLGAHELFESIDAGLWNDCNRNPIAFLDRLSYVRVQELEHDETFLEKLDSVYTAFTAYLNEKRPTGVPRIAYFSMEYGLHSSLKIYSGGLGILAGDYLKEASDKNVPLVAVGLLYRYGYFTQRLSSQGAQEASYEPQNFHKLPISPARDERGNWCTVCIGLPGRTLTARIWKCEVGRTDLYLLDTDHELNLEEDRSITHYLYGGDWDNRLKQEILLGVGGIRALRVLGIEADVYHCNEGHAAFAGLERINELVQHRRLSFSEALEVVRSSSLFTTHTPVPAGHDAFDEAMIRQYMSHYPDRLGITWEQFINLGRTDPDDPHEKFSMSFLACNLSQEVNGVSWLHGEVSKEILGRMWPGYFKDELHIGYVTNGVHFPTWTASALRKLYGNYFPEGFSEHVYSIPAWKKAFNIADSELWDVRMQLKTRLIRYIAKQFSDPAQMQLEHPAQIVRVRENLRPEVLTIGFARRFATYKRAYLLFTDLDRLASIVNDRERPVQFIFAGKAHPNDKPGQDLIRRIIEISRMPRFAGKILFLQNYDMELARKMVQGVDVWLNTPTRPLEASGTSGEKAVMNGVLQFSVLDGWWVEGYREGAGWMLPMERTYVDQRFQDELDAEMIYSTLENQIVPAYYRRNEQNIPYQWLESIKSCIADIASRFTTNRMLGDYEKRFYDKLYARNRSLTDNNFRIAREIAAWKRRVSGVWDQVNIVSVKQVDMGREAIRVGHPFHVEVTVDIATLRPEDIGVELVMASQIDQGQNVKIIGKKTLEITEVDGSRVTYAIEASPDRAGTFDLALRVYPRNDLLPHRMDFALVKWA